METKEIKLTRWDGGMSDDVREPSGNKFSISKHFDIYSNPYRLTPYRDTEADQTGQYKIGAFLYSSVNPTSGVSELLGLGGESANSNPHIYYKSTNIVTDNWNAGGDRTNWALASGSVQYELFIEYQSFIYFWVGTALLKAYLGYGTGIATVDGTITTTARAQGLIHSATNVLYIPYSSASGTFIGTVNGTTWTAGGGTGTLTISSNLRIVSLAEYGNYLAIFCKDVNGGNSKVLLWDLSSTKPSEIIDWGNETLALGNNLEGALVGVGTTSGTFGGVSGQSPKIVIRRWAGGVPQIIKELKSESTSTLSVTIPTTCGPVNFVKNNKLYFSATLTGNTPTTSNIGLFTLGRKSSNYNYALTLDRFATNDNSEANVLAAYMGGDILWTVHTAAGTITRTNDQPSYTATSIYESQKFRDFSLAHLENVKMSYLALPSSGQVKLLCRVDDETLWRQIFVDSTDSSVGHNSKTIENYGDTVTMTQADPCVVTLTNHGLVAGSVVRFSVSGVGSHLLTGVTAGKDYYVISTGLTANTFRFSTTVGGAAVATTGTQSGTITINRDSPLPNFKEIQFRIESTGGAEITSLAFTYSEKEETYG